jgi:DNA-binding response OmpR family regulator
MFFTLFATKGGESFRLPALLLVVAPISRELATVVVCEDDEPTLELLCDHLTADRFKALPAPSAADALRHCRYKQPDLLILDLGLPDAAGLDVLREIRTSDGVRGRFDADLPVIVLSGRGAEIDRVRGFEEGADDYVVKPFHYQELVARMRAVLRRRIGLRRGPQRVGDLQIDSERRWVTVCGRHVDLTNKEFVLLQALARDPIRVFSKLELLRDVWGYRTLAHTRTLDSHASRLRQKLCDGDGRYVVNCWGIGYRLVDG